MQKIPEFGKRLSELMLEADNITTDKLGEALGFMGSTIRLWKTGKRNPTLANIIRIADYFGCSLDFLFGRSDDDMKFVPQPIPPFYEHFISLLSERGISWYKVVKDTKLSKSNIQDWREGREPLMPTLLDLANYLEVTIDYLVGREK